MKTNVMKVDLASFVTHEWLLNPCRLGGPGVGGMAPAFSGVPTRGQNQKWLPNPCLLGGTKLGGMATSINMVASPLPSRVPMVVRDHYGYITGAFLGSPWWGEINTATSPLPSWGPHGGERIYSNFDTLKHAQTHKCSKNTSHKVQKP